jgi:hypothetical protein
VSHESSGCTELDQSAAGNARENVPHATTAAI